MTSTQYQLPRNTTALAVGFGVGILWLLMAATCLWSALRGYQNQRYDWGLVWGLVGLLLLAAALGSMIGTWWHLTRVHDDY